MQILLAQGLEVGRATVPFFADGVEYPAGTYVLPRSQPYGTFLKDLFEVQRYPDGPAPYDVAGWTLPILFGVRRVEVVGRLEVTTTPVTTADLPRELLGTPTPPSVPYGAGLGTEATVGRTVKEVRGLSGIDSRTIGHLVTLLQAGAPVLRAAEGPDGIRGGWIPLPGWKEKLAGAGKRPDELEADLVSFGRSLDEEYRKPVWGLATEEVRTLPRVAIYAPWTASKDEGWLRWTFEHLGFPYTQVRNARVRAGQLRRDFDVLILPSVGKSTLAEGRKKWSVFPELSGGLDPEGSIAIEEFVRGGGTLIACESACAYAIDLFGMPIEDVTRGSNAQGFNCPGSVLRTVPTRSRHAAGLAMSQPIFFSRSAAFRSIPPKKNAPPPSITRGPWTPHLTYPNSQVLLSGYIAAPETLAESAAWGSMQIGQGEVHLFGFRPHYRSWSHGAFWLLFRAILLK